MSKFEPKVSIIINCHNGEEFLKETLESINNQTYNDYEIVFYDNVSNDRTAEIAKEYGKNLNYHRSDTFLALGAARNEAIKLAKGKYIAFLDSDDLWDSDKLIKQVAILDARQDIGLVMCNFRTYNMMRNKLQDVEIKKDTVFEFDSFVLNYAFALSTFLVRKSCFEELPMIFDERLHYAEEYDLFSRISYKWKSYYIGIPLTTRRMHEKMNSIKLAERIPVEHQMTLDNLRAYISNFDVLFPNIVRKISYLRDYMDAKAHFSEYKNKKIRKMMIPYIWNEKRAFEYFVIALLPQKFSDLIIQKIYKNHI